ncbi:cytochrome P450 [Xylariales sp. PMI_506]|nr:cytochrome P450 [Xylariales sp. PMI_506]
MAVIEHVYENLTPRQIGFFSFGLIILYWSYVQFDKARRLRRLPGVRAHRLHASFPFGIDMIVKQLRASRRHQNLERFESLIRGSPNFTVEGTILGKRFVLTADPENIKAILATQFTDYGKGEPFHEEWKEFLGDSIFTTDGDKWHTSRQLIRPMFVKERISDLECFESHMQTLFKAIANGQALDGPMQEVDIEAGDGKVLDISDLFFRYTFDVVTDFLLGKDLQTLTTPQERYADAFNEVQRAQAIRTRAGPFRRFVASKSFREALSTMDELCNTYIDRALRLSRQDLESKSKNEGGYTFLHELSLFTRDRTVIRDQLMAVFLAGRDTTAATLSWTLYELARHPEVVRRLRAEIIDQLGLERTPTYHDLKNMKYLQAIMNETLRLYPAVPLNLRLALKDCVLPRGGGPDGLQPVAVLKDTPIGYSTISMQRRPDLYPPPSEKLAPVDEFSPERWAHWQPKPWHYLPFNGGPRICIGQQFALTEMGYVLTRLFQRFERVESYMYEIDGGKPTMKADIVIQPAHGVKVAFWLARQKS